MNRIVSLVLLFFCISGLVSVACNVPQFHCNGFEREYIYSPDQGAEEACKWLNGTEDYNLCLSEYNKMLRAYEEGECVPILSEKHINGETACKVYYYGDRKLQRIICKGPDAKSYESEIRELYN